MSLWRQLSRGIHVLRHRTSTDRAIADEVQHYFDEATAAHEAGGLSHDEAVKAARRELGNPAAIREDVRSYGWENAVETTAADLRYGLRRLRRSPVFTAVTVITLALGIGASTAIFSAAKPVLFERLPYPDADRVVMLWDRNRDGSRADVTFGTYRELVERSRLLEGVAVFRSWQPTLSGSTPERLDGQAVTASFFDVLGVGPFMGRDFTPEDDRVNGPRVVIISHELWQRRFGADPSIIGRHVPLDGTECTVVGVLPPGFENVLESNAEVWRPLQYDASLPSAQGREWGHHLKMVGRIRPDASLDGLRSEIDAVTRDPISSFARPAWAALANGLLIETLHAEVTREIRPALIAVMGAVTLLLLIACVNVTNLLLGRGARRAGEFALRAALGAGRGRLTRQLLSETLVLTALGGAIGVITAAAGLQALLALSPTDLPRVKAIDVDGGVIMFAASLSTLVALVIGVLLAGRAARGDLLRGVQQASRAMAGHHRMRATLVVAEVALAAVLLAGAGLMLRSLQQLFAIPAGFDPANVLTMQVQTAGPRFGERAAVDDFFTRALDAVRNRPGVVSAAWVSQLPMTGDNDVYGVQFEASPVAPSEADQGAFRYAITPSYMETMAIPLRQGRLLNEQDTQVAPRAALISESFARRRFAGSDPIGQRMHVGPTSVPWFTIVGVVGDVKQASLSLDRPDAVYITPSQWHFADRAMWLVVKAHADPASMTTDIRDAIWSVDKDLAVVRVSTMTALVAASEAERGFVLILFQAFGVAALLLAATGVYGVLAGAVAERVREIGVRAALGASRARILSLVLGQGMTLTTAGVALGLVAALGASALLTSLLYGISRLDPITYAATAGALAVVSLIACALPAWQAARIDPLETLRQE